MPSTRRLRDITVRNGSPHPRASRCNRFSTVPVLPLSTVCCKQRFSEDTLHHRLFHFGKFFFRSQRMLQLSATASKTSAFDPDFKLLRSTLLHFWRLTSLFSGDSGRLQERREGPRNAGEDHLAIRRRPRSRLHSRKEPVRPQIPV